MVRIKRSECVAPGKTMKSRRKSAFYVYMHCRPDGSVFYVGKGCGKRARDFASRSQKHHEIVASSDEKISSLCSSPANLMLTLVFRRFD